VTPMARGEMGCAVGPQLIPARGRIDPLLCRLKSLPAGCTGPPFDAFIEDRQDAIADDLHDFAAVPVDGQHRAVEIAVEGHR
jgi:hypothetical protein